MLLLRNQLAIVVRPIRSGMWVGCILASDAVKRIALGDPDAVPAGVYARSYLERIDLICQAGKPKLVPSTRSRAALIRRGQRGS